MKHFAVIFMLIAVSCSANKEQGTDLYSPYEVTIFVPDTTQAKDTNDSGDTGLITCQTDKDCPAMRHKCDPIRHKFVACLEDKDCPKGIV